MNKKFLVTLSLISLMLCLSSCAQLTNLFNKKTDEEQTLAKPASFTATGGSEGWITLSWSAVKTATEYLVYYSSSSTTDDTTYTLLTQTTTTSYSTQKYVDYDTLYYFYIKAYDGEKYSEYANCQYYNSASGKSNLIVENDTTSVNITKVVGRHKLANGEFSNWKSIGVNVITPGYYEEYLDIMSGTYIIKLTTSTGAEYTSNSYELKSGYDSTFYFNGTSITTGATLTPPRGSSTWTFINNSGVQVYISDLEWVISPSATITLPSAMGSKAYVKVHGYTIFYTYIPANSVVPVTNTMTNTITFQHK